MCYICTALEYLELEIQPEEATWLMILVTLPEVLTIVWAIMATKVRNKRLVIIFGAVF